MKKSFFIAILAISITACMGRFDLDGNTDTPDPPICCEPDEHTLTLPSTIEEFDVMASHNSFAIVWQEASEEFSRGWITVTSATEPDTTPEARELEPTADNSLGTLHPLVLWYGHDPQVFYTRFDGDIGRIAMKAYDADSATFGPAEIMPLDGHASISRAVHHPSGELALSWTGWASPGADPNAWFSRLTEAGELIESYPIAPESYAYGPRIKPAANGYSLAYTANDDPDHRRVFTSDWSFSDGLMTPIQLNPDVGRFAALDLAAADESNIVLWQISPNPSYPDLNVAYLSWIGPDGLRDSVILDDIVMGSDVLDLDGEAIVSWCSMDIETMTYSLNVARAASGSFSTLLRQELGEEACDLTQLAAVSDFAAVFWTQAGSQEIHYRMLCD